MVSLIKNGTVVTAESSVKADILIEGERISQVGPDLAVHENITVYDARGKLILPGGVDVHTHFDLAMAGTVTADDHYSGTKAAAFGGTTTVIDFISQDSAHLIENLEAWWKKVEHKAAVDYSAHMNITKLSEDVEQEIPGLVREGITTLKVFSAYNNRLRLSDAEIFKVLRIADRHGMLTMLHAENGDVIDLLLAEAKAAGHTQPVWHARTRPAWGAVEAVLRGAALAAQANAALYIVHMNTAGEVDQLAYAREKGLRVMGETCPQYLYFTEENLQRADGAKWVCSPPLRTGADQVGLRNGLKNGTIQVISTDHCSFFYDGTRVISYEGQPVAIPGKELGCDDFTKIPNGVPGVGDRLPVTWSEVPRTLSPNRFVALNCTNPAKIFGLYPRKGCLQPGSDADVIIWDPAREVDYGISVSKHRTDYNLYEGMHLTGFPEKVFLRGKLIVDGDTWLGKAGSGRFLHRSAGAPIL